MPVIALASPKGGVGKTTTALILAEAFCRRALDVVLLDADPNQPLTAWAGSGRSVPAVVSALDPDQLLTIIDREAARRDMVIVDLEGSASRVVGYAIARSDLVIVPLGASALDAAQAARAVGLVKQEERLLRRSIPCRALFTRTGNIATKAEKALKRELTSAGVAVFQTSVAQKVAFETMFSEGAMLCELLQSGKVAGVTAAIAIADALADEVLAALGREAGRAAA
jgi:chromosome partitioning protein